MKQKIRQQLTDLQLVMRIHQLWESTPPSDDKLASDQPFCIGTLTATQWLQWIFLPRMHALLDANAELPTKFAISPYLEETLKNESYLPALLKPINEMERLLK